MKLPKNMSNHNYYNQEVNIIPYLSDESDAASDDTESPSPTQNGDFSEYMWMENEEEFDEQVMKQLEEEALMEQCIEAMLADEHEAYRQPSHNESNTHCTTPATSYEIVQSMDNLRLSDLVGQSTLNPNATEFVPRLLRTSEPGVPIGTNA